MNKEQMIKRLKRTAILSVIAIIIGAAVAWFQIQAEQNAATGQMGTQTKSAAPIAGASVGGPFTLVDQNGEKRTEQDYADQYKLIYFGFTYCPAICPTELQKMTQVLNTLEPELAEKIQPMLITIDPERDTPEVLKDYVSLFHPRLIGLTGTQPQIDFVKKQYRVFANKVEDEELSDYTMDHSTFVYLMTPDDKLLSIYRMKDTAEYMIEDIRARL